MKKVYMEEVKKHIDHIVESGVIGFKRFKFSIPSGGKKQSTLQAKEMIFRKQVGEKLSLFFSIIPHARQETLMLEFGWSFSRSFPWDIPRLNWLKDDMGELSNDEYIVFFGDLYNYHKSETDLPHTGWDVWACSCDSSDPKFIETFIAEDSIPVSQELAESRVLDALEKIVDDINRFVIPYFEKLIELRQ